MVWERKSAKRLLVNGLTGVKERDKDQGHRGREHQAKRRTGTQISVGTRGMERSGEIQMSNTEQGDWGNSCVNDGTGEKGDSPKKSASGKT